MDTCGAGRPDDGMMHPQNTAAKRHQRDYVRGAQLSEFQFRHTWRNGYMASGK